MLLPHSKNGTLWWDSCLCTRIKHNSRNFRPNLQLIKNYVGKEAFVHTYLDHYIFLKGDNTVSTINDEGFILLFPVRN